MASSIPLQSEHLIQDIMHSPPPSTTSSRRPSFDHNTILHSVENMDTTEDGQEMNDSHVPRLLYTSHFLSTWNSRVFEFGAVLFIASIFPGTLLPTSLYALVRAASAVLLSPRVGQYVDQGDRLRVVRVSIGMSISLFFFLQNSTDVSQV